MTDRAPAVAALLMERHADDFDGEALWSEARRLWPDLTDEEGCRGAAIAAEILTGGIAEDAHEVEALAEALRLTASDEDDLRAQAAEALRGWGEEEVRKLAEATGLPVDVIGPVIAALQRGEPPP